MAGVKTPTKHRSAIDEYWHRRPEHFESRYEKSSGFTRFVQWFLNARSTKIGRLLEVAKGDKVLDVGCGSGVFLEAALHKGAQGIGVDYSLRTLKLAAKRLEYAGNDHTLLCADVRSLPCSDGAFDWVLGIGLVDYIEETEQVLRELSRALKKDGKLILTVTRKWSPFWFLRTKWGIFLREKLLNLPPIIRWFTYGEIKELLQKAGLTIEVSKQMWAADWVFRCVRRDE